MFGLRTDLLELGLLQLDHTNEDDPDFIAALVDDYAPWLHSDAGL